MGIQGAAMEIPPLDETRVSVLDWTDAHTLAYESKIAGFIVPKKEGAALLSSASDEFLCMQNIIFQTALHLAVREDNLFIVELYARRGVAMDIPNKDGDTPLHYAAFHNRPRAAELLLNAGANREALNHKGERPIDDAKMQGNGEMIELLEQSLP